MTWKKPKTRLRWNLPEIAATIVASAALVFLITALFYGYSL
jgi:hypothetical protein